MLRVLQYLMPYLKKMHPLRGALTIIPINQLFFLKH